MSGKVIISASILGADFAHLARALSELEAAGCDEIHLDVMDGHFVDNITLGLPILKAISSHCTIPIEAHMMVTNPRQHIAEFQRAGCSVYTVHYEACAAHAVELAREIKRSGMQAGLALNPATAPSSLAPLLSEYDRVLVMSVVPGKSGQAFIPEVLTKLEYFTEVRAQYGLSDLTLAIDGGIKVGSAEQAQRAGAELFVSATGIFGADGGIQRGVAELRAALTG